MGTSPPFTVISVFNRQETLDEILKESLESECDAMYETVFLDNRDGQFDSAAEALNAGASEANGEYLLFVHQDVELSGDNWLDRAAEWLQSKPDIGIAGLAGMIENGWNPYDKGQNVIHHGAERREWRMGNEIEQLARVQTVDEMAFAIPSEVYATRGFDETVCDGWHLYAVEYALYHRYRTDREPYVLPLDIWHASTGMRRDRSYYETLRRLGRRYPQARQISTTCGVWPNDERYLAGITRSFSLLTGLLPSSAASVISLFWPTLWGGGIPLLWNEGIAGLPAVVSELRNR
jgi:hypothetical protein